MKKNKKKSRRIWLWVIISSLLVLPVAASAIVTAISHYRTIADYQKEYENAFSYSEQYDKDELEEIRQELNYNIHDTLAEQLPQANMEILNARDRRKLSEGELNPEQTAEIFREAKKRAGIEEPKEIPPASTDSDVKDTASTTVTISELFGANLLQPSVTDANKPNLSATSDSIRPPLNASSFGGPEPTPEAGNNPVVSPSPTPIPHRSVDAIIEAFYVLKSKYITSLDGMLRQCKVEWRSKPKSEQTFSARLAMAEKCMQLGSALEAQCDAEMASLMAELKLALTQSGQSTDIIPQIQNVYDQEKEIKKAALIDRYYPK